MNQHKINQNNKFTQSTYIYVRFSKEGIHCFPEAGTNENLQDVSFLQHPHRHIFYFKVSIEVTHDNRDIEFIQFKRFLEQLYDNKTLDLNNKSCEMIANDLFYLINKKYNNRNIIIDVSEDDENGCVKTYRVSHD